MRGAGRAPAAAALAATLLLVPASGAGEVIRAGGSGTPLAVMSLLGDAFSAREPGVRLEVLTSLGSSGGVKAVKDGAIDLGVLTRRLNEKEAGPALAVFEIARTPFVPVANRDVSVSGVTLEEVARIYAGKTTVWPDGHRLRVVLRPQYDSDTLYLQSMSRAMSEAMETAFSLPGLQTGISDQENTELLEKIPGSFGFSTIGQMVTERRTLKTLVLDGTTPSVQALAEGRYRFYKPFYLLTRGEPGGALARLIAFIRSPEGSRILSANGYLPLALPAR